MQISHGNEDWRVGKEPLRAKCVTQVRRNKKKKYAWYLNFGCSPGGVPYVYIHAVQYSV